MLVHFDVLQVLGSEVVFWFYCSRSCPLTFVHFDVLQEPANSTTHRQLNLAITGFMFLLFMTKIHWSCLRGLQTLRQLRFCLLSTSGPEQFRRCSFQYARTCMPGCQPCQCEKFQVSCRAHGSFDVSVVTCKPIHAELTVPSMFLLCRADCPLHIGNS